MSDWVKEAYQLLSEECGEEPRPLLNFLHRLDFTRLQPIKEQRYDTLRRLMKGVMLPTNQRNFTAEDREDFTAYLGCLLKLKIFPTSDIIELFISHRMVFIKPLDIRTNYYNYRKNKKMIELQDLLNVTIKEVQDEYQRSTKIQDQQQQDFTDFYFRWLKYINNDYTELNAICGDVLMTIKDEDQIQASDPKLQEIMQIKQLEKQINAKLAQQNRLNLIHPLDRRDFTPRKKQEKVVQFTQPELLPPTNLQIPPGIDDLFPRQQNLTPLGLNIATFTYQGNNHSFSYQMGQLSSYQLQESQNLADLSVLSDYNNLTGGNIRSDNVSANFIMDKPVIAEKDNTDEVSSALIHLAYQQERSEQEENRKDKTAPSLFSSFL